MRSTLFTIILGFATQTILFADTIYVDPSLNVNGDGTIDLPYNTWNNINWKPGYTYLQKRGTTYRSTIKVDETGLSDSWITIGAYGEGEKPLVTTNDQLGFEISDISYIKIQDFRIETSGQERYFKNSGIKGNRGNYNTFENLEIGPAAGHGIYVQDKNNVVVRSCYFHNAGTKEGWDSCDNLHLENCHDYLVEYCVSHDCRQGAEFDASDGGTGYTTGTWRYNIGYDSEDSEAWSHFKMSGQHPSSSVLLLYNIAYGAKRGPGYALQESLTATAIGNVAYNCQYGFQQKHHENIIKNNIVMNCAIGLYIDGPFPQASNHNIWYNNDRMGLIQDGQIFQTLEEWQMHSGRDERSLDSDPMFISASYYNFTLQPGSPAIDNAEILDSAYAYGLHPLSRWTHQVQLLNQNQYGNGWDIGAYPYTPISTGLIEKNKPAILYPNPAREFIMVDYKNMQGGNVPIDILNFSGQKIITIRETVSKRIDISLFPAGLYFVISENKILGKFVKL